MRPRQVGFSKDSRLPAEFDVTERVSYGSSAKNLLSVMVVRWSDASYLEDQVCHLPWHRCETRGRDLARRLRWQPAEV